MAVCVDALFGTEWADKSKWPYKQSCHLTSDLPGDEGRAELLDFATRLGLKSEWRQHWDRPTFHFDLTASMRAKAIRLGAKEIDLRGAPEQPHKRLVFGVDPPPQLPFLTSGGKIRKRR